MRQENTTADNGAALRYSILVPLALMIAATIACCLSYSNARQNIADDLNEAMFALANENSEQWTSPDTIAAIRHMYATTKKPLIYQASDVRFRNPSLKDEAYFTLAVVDRNNVAPGIKGRKISSDSIILVPRRTVDGLAIQVQGFADCSMASVFVASDQTLPGILFALSLLSMAGVSGLRRKRPELSAAGSIAVATSPSLEGIRLTPMQRQLAQMLLDAPNMRVDKRRLCESLWGNKSNAEESLYTLVRRTKAALAETGMEIVCNRGDSYELHVKS